MRSAERAGARDVRADDEGLDRFGALEGVVTDQMQGHLPAGPRVPVRPAAAERRRRSHLDRQGENGKNLPTRKNLLNKSVRDELALRTRSVPPLEVGVDSVSYTALSPLSFLERSARVWPDKTAVVYGARRLTYRELAAEAQRVARALRASGAGPGDRVAYLMPNLPEMLIAHYAVPLAGAVLVAVNTRLTAEEMAYILSHSGAKIVVVDAALLPTAAAAAKDVEAVAELVIAEDAELEPDGADPTAEPRLVSYSEFLARGTQEPLPWSVPDELAPIAINYTSGTTGRPRGVIYTHRGAYLNCFGEIVHSRNDENSVYLWTLPMFHCNGWCTPWSLTAIGGTHVCLREVRGDAIWQQLREHDVTHLNAAPTVVSTILNAPEAGPLTRPVLITTAGAPPSPTTIAQMERMGFQIVHVYGLTETYGPISVCQSQPQWADLPAERACRAAGSPGRGHDPGRRPAGRGPRDGRRPGRRQHDGRDRHARQQRHGRLLP